MIVDLIMLTKNYIYKIRIALNKTYAVFCNTSLNRKKKEKKKTKYPFKTTEIASLTWETIKLLKRNHSKCCWMTKNKLFFPLK